MAVAARCFWIPTGSACCRLRQGRRGRLVGLSRERNDGGLGGAVVEPVGEVGGGQRPGQEVALCLVAAELGEFYVKKIDLGTEVSAA